MSPVDLPGAMRRNPIGAFADDPTQALVRPWLMKLGMAIREAHRQRRRPQLVVYCPYERAQAVTARSRRGPICSGCSALIDQSRNHSVIEVRSPSLLLYTSAAMWPASPQEDTRTLVSQSPARARRNAAHGGEASRP
jgi:hypothetical protein